MKINLYEKITKLSVEPRVIIRHQGNENDAMATIHGKEDFVLASKTDSGNYSEELFTDTAIYHEESDEENSHLAKWISRKSIENPENAPMNPNLDEEFYSLEKDECFICDVDVVAPRNFLGIRVCGNGMFSIMILKLNTLFRKG